jgi:rod shape determining protein RodA
MPMAVDRRLFFNVDWVLLGASLLLCLAGIATILSATQTGRFAGLHVKQLYLLLAGLAGLAAGLVVDYRRLADRSPVFYVLAVLVLGWLLVFGPRVAGAHRWIVVGSFQLQPSELVKLVAALLVAKMFSEERRESLGLLDVALPGAAVGVLALLIAAEPDLGTAFCLVPLFLSVAFLAGLRMKAVAGMLVVLAILGGLGWHFALKDYQKARIYTFLDPSLDPKGAGYQKIQSEIAVGSGGLAGKGYRNGSQSQLGYLPARHTDFVFSVMAEELGFLGVSAVLGLYLLVLWRILDTAQVARDRVGAFLATAIAATLGFQVVYNVAMVAGLVPVKGLPLPFMSYGGSSLIASLMAIGLVLNVRMRRFAN